MNYDEKKLFPSINFHHLNNINGLTSSNISQIIIIYQLLFNIGIVSTNGDMNPKSSLLDSKKLLV